MLSRRNRRESRHCIESDWEVVLVCDLMRRLRASRCDLTLTDIPDIDWVKEILRMVFFGRAWSGVGAEYVSNSIQSSDIDLLASHASSHE